MRNALHTALIGTLGLSFLVVACGDDDEQPPVTPLPTTTSVGGGTTTTTTGDGGSTTSVGGGGAGGAGGGMAMVPVLGTQVDRIGRPAINTAGNETFTDDATRGASEDAYNAASNPADWATSFVPVVTNTLAILDSLDNTCENQLLYGLDASLMPNPTCPDDGNDTCYGALATLLANDWLVIKGDATERGLGGSLNYLAVESDAVGSTNDQAGGRTPAMDVIDVSYTVLASGGDVPVADNIGASAAAQVTAFPYLAAPN